MRQAMLMLVINMSDKTDVLQGTLDLMVLKTLDTLGTQHGYGIAQRLQQVSNDLLQVNQGTLYPALLRLEQRGWIGSKWGTFENNRRARFHAPTPARRQPAPGASSCSARRTTGTASPASWRACSAAAGRRHDAARSVAAHARRDRTRPARSGSRRRAGLPSRDARGAAPRARARRRGGAEGGAHRARRRRADRRGLARSARTAVRRHIASGPALRRPHAAADA